MTFRRALVLALLAAVLVGLAPPATASSSTEPSPRLLVVSIPGVTWADVQDHDLPNLEAFFADAALADLAPRGVRPRSGPGDAYLTISAGSRASTSAAVDGQVLGVAEQSSGSVAGEIFTRRTGIRPDGGEYVVLSWPALVRANDAEPYGAVPGLLADTLAEAGITTHVIGNADGTDSVGASYERQAGLAFSTTDGVVPSASLKDVLNTEDATRPYGVRTDSDFVVERFTAAWNGPTGDAGHVALVEASDLARTLRYRPIVERGRYAALWEEALRDADALLGRLMAEVDPERDSVLVLAPYHLTGDRDLVVVGLRSPDLDVGYLRSASTQRSGFLTLVDVAPTVLDRFGVERPVEMEGRSAEIVGSGASLEDRIDRLVTLNAASRFRERLLVPTTVVAVVGLALIAAATAVVLARGGGQRWHPRLRFAVLVVLGILPLSYVARAFPLEELGILFYWSFTLGAALVAAAIVAVAANRLGRPRLALVAMLALVSSVLVFDVMTGSRLSLSAAFGYSPTGNSRLYGISNYAYGMLGASVCVLAGLLAGGTPRDRARWLGLGLLVATLIVLGVPIWGTNVGGVLSFTPAVGMFVVVAWKVRLRLRTLLLAGLATVAAITSFGLLDLSRPAGQRAHLGRLFERLGDEGIEPLFAIMERKLLASLSVSTSSMWVAAIPVAIAFWAFLTRYPGRPLAPVERSAPALHAGLAAGLVVAVLGSLLNDSGAIVGGVTLLVLTASLIHLVLESAVQADAR
jgi:hypothetical protein